MKFLKTIDLWAHEGAAEAIITGRLKLQPGQWVRCGNERRSRIVKVSKSGVIWATHPQREGKGRDSRQYAKWLDAVRSQREVRQAS